MCILNILKQADRPFTVDEILKLSKELIPSIGLRTIYRNIDALIDDSQLARVDYPGQPMRYEFVTGHERPHIICTTCKKVFWMNGGMPKIEIEEPDFNIIGVELILYGNCQKNSCSKREDKSFS